MANEATVDPIDAMDLSDVVNQVDSTETTIPDEMVLDGQREAAPDAEHDETPEEAAERARDEKGRFAKKEEEPTPEGQSAAEKPAAVKPEAVPTPFQYRAMGANHALDGASLDDAGNLLVKGEQVGLIREALNALHAREAGEEGAHTFIAKRDEKIAELGGQVEDLKVLAQTAEALISFVESLIRNPNDDQALNDFWKLRQGGWDIQMAKAENQFLNSQLQRATAQRQSARTPDARQAQEETGAAAMPSREDAVATTVEYIERAKLTGEFKSLTEQDWTQLAGRAQRTPYLFLREATAEDLKDPKNRGLAMGQIVFDKDAFHDHLAELAQIKVAAAKKTKLAADNARRTQPSITTPPTPGGGRQAVGAGKKGFQSEKDVDNWLESDEL